MPSGEVSEVGFYNHLPLSLTTALPLPLLTQPLYLSISLSIPHLTSLPLYLLSYITYPINTFHSTPYPSTIFYLYIIYTFITYNL